MTDGPKLCLYCLRPFTGRGRCCSKWCSRKVSGKTAWVTRSRNETQQRAMAAIQKAVKHVPRFRRVAMGTLTLGDAWQEIYGVPPDPGPPRHGDDLDA